MPHYPRPFFKASRGRWYLQIGPKQFNLGPDEDEAFKKYHEIMRQHADGVLPEATSQPDALTAVELFDKFLDACRKDSAPRTYESYRDRLQFFVRHLKEKKRLSLAADDLRPFHVLEWLDSHESWNPGMRRGAIQSVQRAYNWAVEVGLVKESPVKAMRKPPPGRRERSVTEEEFTALMAQVPEGPFKDLLRFAWLTGCRPQEAIRIEGRHLDLERGWVLLPPNEAKGKKRARVIYLVDAARTMLAPLAEVHREGPLFRNKNGRPWTRFAVNCAFCRLQIVTGMKRMKELGVGPAEEAIIALIPSLKPKARINGVVREKRPAELREEAKRKLTYKMAKKYADKCCLYLARHSFSTNALRNGVDPMTVSVLLGHANGATLAKVYSHLSQHPDHLQDAAKKATGG
jgi:integrase